MKILILSILSIFASVNICGQKIGEKVITTLKLKSYSCGDGCYYEFVDAKTKKQYIFARLNQFDNNVKGQWKLAIDEIEENCNGNDDCKFDNQIYSAIIIYKNVDEYQWTGEEWIKTGKKEKAWVITNLSKLKIAAKYSFKINKVGEDEVDIYISNGKNEILILEKEYCLNGDVDNLLKDKNRLAECNYRDLQFFHYLWAIKKGQEIYVYHLHSHHSRGDTTKLIAKIDKNFKLIYMKHYLE
jgi:hypothetical protein